MSLHRATPLRTHFISLNSHSHSWAVDVGGGGRVFCVRASLSALLRVPLLSYISVEIAWALSARETHAGNNKKI